MNSKTTSEKLIQFIENSPSAFHTVETIKFLLLKNNFSELCENKHWHITAGGNYFVTRNNSSLIAFPFPKIHLQECVLSQATVIHRLLKSKKIPKWNAVITMSN